MMSELEDLPINSSHHWLYAIGGGQLTPWYFSSAPRTSRADSGEPGKALQQRATGAGSGTLSDWHARNVNVQGIRADH